MQQYDRARQTLAIAAAALAGSVDAVGFLLAGRYFVSFMSGNTTRLGIDLATRPASAIIPLLLIGGFVAGVTGGALLAVRAGPARKTAVLGTVAVLLAGAALARQLALVPLGIALMVVAMGVLNNTFQRQGEVAVGLTYMTGALVRAGQGLAARLQGQRGQGWAAWLALWLALATGAFIGAAGWLHAPGVTLWAAAAWAVVLAICARRLPPT